MGTKNQPGAFDCYANAQDDEPMFVLLARDPDAPKLVALWARLRQEREGMTDQVAEAMHCVETMEAWKRTHRRGAYEEVDNNNGGNRNDQRT